MFPLVTFPDVELVLTPSSILMFTDAVSRRVRPAGGHVLAKGGRTGSLPDGAASAPHWTLSAVRDD